MRTLTVVVNRRVPFAPQNVLGGRNNGVVELQWSPAKEHDLVGFRAYRKTDTGWVQACALTPSTTCQDAAAPTGDLTYEIVGVDRDASVALREGDRSADIAVRATNAAPPAPASLTATTVDGNVVLSWPAAGADPDPGDVIDHYNIYRDGQAYADRYDRTPDANALTYTDTHTNGQTHTYWVTTVDSQLGESPMAGPVTK
jgi:fibronectin type 3 domain-containing protein